MTDARRAGVVVLLVLLAGGALLASLPRLGSVRLAGVALLWWYAVLVAPALGALVTGLVLARARRPASAAAWLSPALVASLAAHVVAGEPGAPLLALVACLAPLLARLWALPSPAGRSGAALTMLGTASVGLVLWASLAVVADLARVLGGARWLGLAVAAALGLGLTRASAGARVRRVALTVGVAGLVLPLLAIAAMSGRSPWEAWSALASRSALVFRERSAWVTEGAVLLVPTSLVFSEPHRITALGEAVFRVVERDGDRVVVREWRLARGEGLALRPGDRLDLAAGVRVRFEPGKRVPEAPLSGVIWADPRERSLGTALATFLAALVTLAGGALVLLPPRRDGDGPHVAAGLAPLGALAVPLVVVGAVCWGVYGGFAGPELALGAPAVASLARLPWALPGPPWDRALVLTVLIALMALFVATTSALHDRVLTAVTVERGTGRGARVDVVWLGLLAGATALAAWPVDTWRALTLALGLAAVAIAPALAGAGSAARAAGALVGAAVFAALALAGPGLAAGASVVGAYPALVAAPVAWAVAALGVRWEPDKRRVLRAKSS
ncbi:MAG TPA: hypothetical protein VGV13_09285 [Methylomirabilota bacterium]|jgi:hypothetical protein|nr:hypothetical protein [Methylomirabilota bacterium]